MTLSTLQNLQQKQSPVSESPSKVINFFCFCFVLSRVHMECFNVIDRMSCLKGVNFFFCKHHIEYEH